MGQGESLLERKEATSLLKEIIGLNLLLPSLIDLEPNKHGKFDLLFKGDCDTQAFKQFIADRKLCVSEDTKKGYFVISKP